LFLAVVVVAQVAELLRAEKLGGAVQVDPRFSQLTPSLLPALETKI